MEKPKVNTTTVKPVPYKWDYYATYSLVGGLVIGIFGGFLLGSPAVFAVSNFLGFVGLAVFKSRAATPDARPILLSVLLPLGLGVSLVALPLGSVVPSLICFGTAAFGAAWFLVLRYPPPYRKALKEFRAGNLMEAAGLASQAIDEYAPIWETYQLRSAIHVLLYELVEGEYDARQAVELGPAQYMCHAALGTALISQQKYGQAREPVDKALELAPQMPVNHYNKGVLCYRLGEYEGAIPYLRYSIGKSLPQDCQMLGHYYLGTSLMHMGNAAEAQVAYGGLKKYRATYDKFSNLVHDAPDYPSVLLTRQDLEQIKRYID